MFKKILVCIGSTPISPNINSYLIEQAKDYKSQVILVKVKTSEPPVVAVNVNDQFPLTLSTAAVTLMDKDEKRTQEYLDMTAASMVEQGVNVKADAGAGIDSRNIGQYARANGADLIVMTAQAYKGWKRLFAGSTVEDVMRETDIPLLIINPHNAKA